MTGTEVTGNRQLAARARAIADQAASHRRAALAVSVALDETRTVAAARKVLAGLGDIGRPDLAAAASQILDQLATEPEESP